MSPLSSRSCGALYTAVVYCWKDGACFAGDSVPKTQQAGPSTEFVPVMCSLHVASRKE